jgi:Fe-S-cluster-containing dehydrogenase component/DMSO reductase anchor subunit
VLASRENLPLLAELLAEQQRLETPVARFSAAHDSGSIAELSALAVQLIPVSAPKPGEQYAFEVNLDSCTGCKSCVAACHSLNGLDETETWRDVGLLVSPSRARPFTQTVTTACHHCADPGCLNGCPVLAYEKDPVTGIVRHLDDQCIGCSYCILKCPYDVPKFSERLGIVRKCDMCHSRLAAGEAPACAEACPTHAIRIVNVPTSVAETQYQKPETGNLLKTGNRKPETGEKCRSDHLCSPQLSSAESVSGLQPPTSDVPNFSGFPLVSGFRSPVSGLQHVSGFRSPVSGFQQVSVLSNVVPTLPFPSYTQPTTRYVSKRRLPENLVAADASRLQPQPPHWPLVLMLTFMPAAVGLTCSAVFHSSGPVAVTDWLVRLAWLAGLLGLGASVFHLGQPLRAWRIFLGWRRSWLSREAMVFGAWFAVATGALFEPRLISASAIVGLTGLACSAMIYIDTHRHFWRAAQTAPRFFGTAALFGLAPFAPLLAAGMLILKCAWEWRTHYDQSISARLQRGPLSRAVFARDGFGMITLVLLVVCPGWPGFVTLLAGEVAERYLFFRAVDAPKMPGITP